MRMSELQGNAGVAGAPQPAGANVPTDARIDVQAGIDIGLDRRKSCLHPRSCANAVVGGEREWSTTNCSIGVGQVRLYRIANLQITAADAGAQGDCRASM